MRAIVVHGANDLRVEEVESPKPGPGEVEIALDVGGICGSDLHYFHEGRVGEFAVREPLIVGHELAGTVVRTAEGLEVGSRVVVDPGGRCGKCAQCRSDHSNLCENVRFLGSAARMPHVQGGFRERLVVRVDQCIRIPDHLSTVDAVFAEPLAVALHAVARGGELAGRDVLVLGAGPIGSLIALVLATASGAATVTLADIHAHPLEVTSGVVNVSTLQIRAGEHDLPAADVVFEASGAPDALRSAMDDIVKPAGRIVLVGILPEMSVAMSRAVTREIELAGSFRFQHSDFVRALELLATGLPVSGLVTARFDFGDAKRAFEEASRRDRSLKVQIVARDL